MCKYLYVSFVCLFALLLVRLYLFPFENNQVIVPIFPKYTFIDLMCKAQFPNAVRLPISVPGNIPGSQIVILFPSSYDHGLN